MRATLFDDMAVEITPETARIGKIFFRRGNEWRAEAMAALRWLHLRAQEIEAPVLLDIGAHTGAFSLLAAHHPGMTVYAFEPLPRAFRHLIENVALNDLQERIQCTKLALGAATGATVLHIPKQITHWSLATVGTPTRLGYLGKLDTEHVLIQTLDGWAKTHALPHIDLVKIDTEGAELSILQGGEDTLRAHRPAILLEYEPMNTRQFGYRPEALKELLEDWGATCELLPPRDLVATWND